MEKSLKMRQILCDTLECAVVLSSMANNALTWTNSRSPRHIISSLLPNIERYMAKMLIMNELHSFLTILGPTTQNGGDTSMIESQDLKSGTKLWIAIPSLWWCGKNEMGGGGEGTDSANVLYNLYTTHRWQSHTAKARQRAQESLEIYLIEDPNHSNVANMKQYLQYIAFTQI